MKLGKLEINLDELANFLVVAKKNGYAGSDNKLREVDGSKTFTFQEGNFHYTDNYAGSAQAPGTELVRWQRPDGQRIWQMSYSGGMLPGFWDNKEVTERTYGFLKMALMQVTPELPFRGPKKYIFENFKYNMNVRGNLQRFSGSESIVQFVKGGVGRFLFTQDFIGGLVVPKTQ